MGDLRGSLLGGGDGEVVAVEWVDGGIWLDELDSSELLVCSEGGGRRESDC